MDKFSPRYILLLASILSISPALFRHIGADVMVYTVWLQCFAEQFWQGDIYPRWCFNTNAGLGTSVFMFYFPSAFYVAAILYPLVKLGLTLHAFFVFLCWLAGLLGVFTCYAWLRDIVKPPIALLASVLFLFLPYRMEMLFFRGAYSEVWIMALLPLYFKYTRRIALGTGSILPLTATIALLMLTHIPITAEALLFGGIYVLSMSGKTFAPKARFAASVIWGVALSMFYLLPAVYYHHFMASDSLASGLYGWPNNFLSSRMFEISGLERPLLAAGLGALVLTSIAATALLGRKRIADPIIRRETTVWVCIGFTALLLVFPITQPLYALSGPLAKILFPWRMQMMVMFATAYLFAIWMQWLASEKKRKTWKADFAVALLFLWAISNALMSTFSNSGNSLNDEIVQARIVFASEYRSQWTDEEQGKYDYLLERTKQDIPKIAYIKGEGSFEIKNWNWNGLTFAVDTRKPATLRLNHSYFPVWQASLYQGNIAKPDSLELYPEDHTGLMLLNIPPGQHLVTVFYDITDKNPMLLASQWGSWIAFFALVCALLRAKIFDKRSVW